MNIDEGKKSRAALKTYFVKNAIPTESQFAQFIDSGLNQRDDGLVKAAGDPLSIEAAGDAASFKKALNFYGSFADAEPAFTIALRPRVAIGDPGSGRPGFSIGDAAGNSRLCIDAANGNVGVGTAAPAERLDVTGRVKAGNLTVGPWPANPGSFAFFGTNALDQTAQGNYALLQDAVGSDAGRTYLNSPVDIRFRINNVDKMVLAADGDLSVTGAIRAGNSDLYFTKTDHDHSSAGNAVGNAAIENAASHGALMILGRTVSNSPLKRVVKLWDELTVNGELIVTDTIKSGKLSLGPWPANPGNYVFFGTNALDQAVAGNYALLQDAAGSDAGRTYLNSPVDIRFRIGNADKMVLAGDGSLSVTGAIRAGNSDLYFTNSLHNHSGAGNALGNAAIENGANFGALMILGRTVTTSPLKRVVKLWDELTVHGPLIVTASHTIKIGVPSPKNPPRYGNDGIRGEPNLWLDAAGTVFIKPGFQTPSGFDIAERFATVEPLAVGTVVIFDEEALAVRCCDRAADGRVVGIVSGDAAFILGSDETEVPIALVGRVPCRVDADILPVRSGDLLTTSTTPGHAQRVDDAERCRGAIIGKALTSLATGKGSVLVLVNGY